MEHYCVYTSFLKGQGALLEESYSDARHWNSHTVKYERPSPIFRRSLWERYLSKTFILHFFITSYFFWHFVICQFYFKVNGMLEDHALSVVRQCLFSTLTSWDPLPPSETSEYAMPRIIYVRTGPKWLGQPHVPAAVILLFTVASSFTDMTRHYYSM
jgi:hypothetical protein